MRPTLRRIILRTSPLAIVLACAMALASSAPGLTLYDGSYSTDLSTSTPGGLSPANGVTLPYPSSNINMSWDAVPGANRYQLQVARQSSTSADCAQDGAFQLDNIVLTTSVDDTQWVPSLSDSAEGKDIWVGTYCWRVRTTGKGYGEWSSAHRFTRTWSSSITGLKFFNDHDGPIPRTTSSADWATGNSVTRNAGYVTWNALEGASEYEVQIASSQSFADGAIVTSREGIRDTQTVLLHLPDDTYYWRVRGIAPNGTEGGWSSGSNTFTVRWYDPNWSDPSRLWPANGSTIGEIRFGWTPMPGATRYEYQVGTNAGCFWNPDVPQLAPLPYGSWVQYSPEYDSSDPPNLLATRDPHPTHCRISDVRATTLNNWVTQGLGDEAIENINKQCLDVLADPDTVLCEPAGYPTSTTQDFGAIYSGANEIGGSVGNYYWSGDGRYSEPYSIFWRTRPVYYVDQDRETAWKIGGDGEFMAYGSWTQHTSGGVTSHHSFGFDPTADASGTTDSRCTSAANAVNGNGCLTHVGTTMQADEAPGVTDDRTMQFPLFTWQRFPNAGGYIFEIARDPLFNSIVRTTTISAMSHSLAYEDALPDNSEDTGYWWRVVPCTWDPDGIVCLPTYPVVLGGLPFSYGLGGHSDAGVYQTFPKQSNMQVELVPNFEGATPLIRWARVGTSATDYSGWSQGLAGAAYYELELARDPFFSSDKIEIKTSIPRAVPFESASEGKVQQLDDGLWYYRVRAVDDNDVEGGWSAVGSFNKRVEAPVPTGANGGSGPGVVVTWSPVVGASGYEVQWTDDSGFEKASSSSTTLQTSFRIPGDELGRHYWRVRAVVGDVKGQWSGQVRYVDIVPPTTIRYGLNRAKTLAGDKVQITGELKVAGSATNNQRLRLQRKTGGCDNMSGRYVDSSVAVTGEEADDGMVNIPARVLQNTCFRYAWSNASGVRYSAPISVGVVPNVKAFKNRKVVRRSLPMCVTITSNRPINGRMRIQYRAGKTWRTARSRMLRNHRRARQCVRFTKAGRYSTRVYFDHMKKSGATWVQYENVMRGMGMVRVNDVWRIVRSR